MGQTRLGSAVPLRAHRAGAVVRGLLTVETGALVGRLSFNGEGGYARVRSRAVPATMTRQPKMTCHVPPDTKAGGSHESSSVGGSFGRRGRQLGVSANEHPALGTLTLNAYSWARRDGVRVNRWVSAAAPLTALAVDRVAESATLNAPSPFTGSATFHAFPGKEAGTWRGDLAVDFPRGTRGAAGGQAIPGREAEAWRVRARRNPQLLQQFQAAKPDRDQAGAAARRRPRRAVPYAGIADKRNSWTTAASRAGRRRSARRRGRPRAAVARAGAPGATRGRRGCRRSLPGRGRAGCWCRR